MSVEWMGAHTPELLACGDYLPDYDEPVTAQFGLYFATDSDGAVIEGSRQELIDMLDAAKRLLVDDMSNPLTPEQVSEAFTGSEQYAAGRMTHSVLTRRRLDLGTEYTFEEVSLGTGGEIAAALLALSRDIAFRIQQDPYYGTDGDLYMHHPALGLYSVECTAQGQPVIGYDAVQAAVDKAMGDDDGAARVRVLAALRALFGLNYTSLFWGTA